MPKKVGRSKRPIAHQWPIITKNLSEKLQTSVRIGITCWHHSTDTKEIEYTISLVPGFDGEDCTQFSFTTWVDLLGKYFFLMKVG